jgi:hypothetical protein
MTPAPWASRVTSCFDAASTSQMLQRSALTKSRPISAMIVSNV